MKEEESGNITQKEQRALPEGVVEQVMESREGKNIAAESRDSSDRGNSRSPLRADSVPMGGFGGVLVDGLTIQPISVATTSEEDASPEIMEKWALDNAPPPIKVRVEGETSEESTPKELSPPPSPKRMREVARKGKVFSQGSI